jgi:putative peptidoglycan lipid II flippase
VRGGLVVGAGILLGNITGFFRVAVAAYLLGTHARADALAVAMGPLDTLNSAIVNTMAFAFAPMLMLWHGGDRAAVFARAGRVFAAILAVVSAAFAVLAPRLAVFLGPGLAPPEHEQVVMLLRLFAPATLFAGGAAIYGALLYTERRFLVPMLYQTCLNGATIAAALTLWNAFGVNGFAIGYTGGAALQLLLTWWFSRDLRRTPRSALRPSAADVLRKPAMFLAYAVLIAANIAATRVFATQAGPGMAAAFEYCMRCVGVVMAYLVYPVATTLVPEIARLRGTNRTAQAYRLIDKSVGLMAAGAAFCCGISILVRVPVIALLFQRGSFTAESTLLVSGVFLGFAPSLFGGALLDLIARCFFALDRPGLPLAVAFIPISVNLIVTSMLRAAGRLMDPAMLGTGASIGLIAGFAALFALMHFRRNVAKLEPSLMNAPS